jgi:serine phosphatase RsbU (regulator of sigma subunit)
MLILILIMTLSSFLHLATKLIREDKAAYVNDAILLRNEEKATSLQSNLAKWSSLLLNPVGLQEYPEIVSFYQDSALTYQAQHWKDKAQPNWSEIPYQSEQILRFEERTFLMLDSVEKKRRLIIQIELSDSKNSPFKTMILSFSGSDLINRNKIYPWFSLIQEQKGLSGAVSANDEIIAFSKIPSQAWIIISTISQKEAFAVAGYLVSKSLYFGLLILGMAIIVGILSVRPLTSQLEKLSQTAESIGAGDFTQKVLSNSHDEIGALSDSFNLMSEKILSYMEEMKEKARLESEMKVAQLVQNAFIPPQKIQVGPVLVQSYTTPASECGGDWWGSLEHNERQIFIIADATGHGVPAALLTATINACKESLKEIFKYDPDLSQSPARMMSYINKVISNSGDKIQMTCFIASWHSASRTLLYSNASHPPALLFIPAQESDITQSGIRPLLEANGPRLGQNTESVFTENYVELPVGANIAFYTDGILEATNPEGQAWGQRRFIKSLTKVLSHDGNPRQLIEELESFHQGDSYDDDVTIVTARLS